jgi:hypothetical protein
MNSERRLQAFEAVNPCALSLRDAATNSQATCHSKTPSTARATKSSATCCRRESDLSQQ